ncbi:MAG: endolytic transglycosylase MltG [Clostridiales bacterium]|nr:endolytic transglycosylase MltG [Clostridiales bacterium]
MKLKYYLRGLGTGILFATLILFISYYYHNTDSQVKERAKELGMVENSSTSMLIPEESSHKKEEETPSGENTPKETSESESKDQNNQDETTTVTPETPAEPATTPASQEPTSINSITECEFTISSGMSSSDVARIVATIGLVEDAESFDRYLIENGYAERIHVGNFKINTGCTFEELARLIAD